MSSFFGFGGETLGEDLDASLPVNEYPEWQALSLTLVEYPKGTFKSIINKTVYFFNTFSNIKACNCLEKFNEHPPFKI